MTQTPPETRLAPDRDDLLFPQPVCGQGVALDELIAPVGCAHTPESR